MMPTEDAHTLIYLSYIIMVIGTPGYNCNQSDDLVPTHCQSIDSVNNSKEDIKEVFSLFDLQGSNRISTNKLGDCLRALGYAPSNSQIQVLIQKNDPNSEGFISLETLFSILDSPSDQYTTVCSKDVILRGFKALDKDGSGTIAINEIKHLLMNIGEKLTETEVDELLSHVPQTKDGCIKYEDLLQTVL
jgi:Ca2+-binding EF-hand superfamily protein